MPEPRLLQGNHACALAAIAAGCRFYAGYPITPSSEIAEWMSRELARVDGAFIQMEDEIASMGAILGASLGGVKAMTATSGPGFSLKQENLGYAVMAEIPCVVINIMRGGPSTGMPTKPAQADIMQARWGGHGDRPLIALTPDSVQEIYQQTVQAFNLAERYRTPVVLLIDEILGHLYESVQLSDPSELMVVERKAPNTTPGKDFLSYAPDADGVPPMAYFGAGYRTHTTGLTHTENGFPTQDPASVERVMTRLFGKLERNRADIDAYDSLHCGDAEVLIVAYGITARAARRAVAEARAQGIRAGMFRPITLWPFPETALLDAAKSCRAVLVPEMNAGQLQLEIERLLGKDRVSGLHRYDGEPVSPDQILTTLQELANFVSSPRD